ncbi:DNA ligase [Ferriphaselus amnicola]|uniref:DNA ligase n=1 Tax=Ferriphaselus amnicola TaxID=1188319 RepID=A0A2Z6GD82_9PROT|nr:BRCT domain-containing protein [Ferriphaselus amnicola]BBE51155.1 DNA ligase [Ferriphaselus amnicola]
MASTISNSGTVLLLASVLLIPPFAWWVVSQKIRYGAGKHWVIAHAAGFVSGLIAIIFAFVPAAIYEASPIVGIGVLVAIGYWMVKLYRSVCDLRVKSEPPQEPSTPNEKIPSPHKQKADLESEINSLRRIASSKTHCLANIEFDYLDGKGNHSHRRVEVQSIDDEYFEGFCHKAKDERTFVIGRVRGDILDCETGELLSPRQWARAARKNPQNGGVVINRGWKSSDDEIEDKPESIEILFTGFSKERRAELEEQAELFDMVVRKNVTKNLTHLCAGTNAGPAKVAQAQANGVTIIDESEFVKLLGK